MFCFNLCLILLESVLKKNLLSLLLRLLLPFSPSRTKAILISFHLPPVNAAQSNEDALLMIKGYTYMCLLSLPSAPAFLDMHMVQSPVVFVLGRQQACISQLTFRKCHKEGEKHSHPLCSSVKISQPRTEMLKLDFSSVRSVTYPALVGGRLPREFW